MKVKYLIIFLFYTKDESVKVSENTSDTERRYSSTGSEKTLTSVHL